MRYMTLMRVTHISLVFNALAWLSLLVTPYAAFLLFPAVAGADLHVVLVFHDPAPNRAARQRRPRLADQHAHLLRQSPHQFRRLSAGPGLPFAAPPLRQRAALSPQGAARGVCWNVPNTASRRWWSKAISSRTASRRGIRQSSKCWVRSITIGPPRFTSITMSWKMKRSRTRDEIIEQGEAEKRKRRAEMDV